MSSMTNSLERLRKEKEEIKRQRREFKIKFVCLYVSILSHLFFFDISFKYDYARNKVRIIVSEESLSLKVRLTLRLTASKAKWRIVKISHKKFKYIFRVMKPQLIEELIVFLIRYL
ncbi:MAG: hypothetical protein E7L08_29730 [Klebsiella michiganensis]|nr:hypothetical protein [Klebsiella michiganensis]